MTQTDRSNRGRPLFHSETSAIQLFGGVSFQYGSQGYLERRKHHLAIAVARSIKHNSSS